MNLMPVSSMRRASPEIFIRASVSGTWARQTTEFKGPPPANRAPFYTRHALRKHRCSTRRSRSSSLQSEKPRSGMPFSNRPYREDANGVVREFFRPGNNDFKRPQKNGRTMKAAPPETTNAESFYYVKQMNLKTP